MQAVEIIYVCALALVLVFIILSVKKNRGYVVPFVLVLASWIGGEYFVHGEPMTLGCALYALGHLVLYVHLVHVFNGVFARFAGIPVFISGFIFLTGYFWPSALQGKDMFNVINAGEVVIVLSTALIFAVNKTKHRTIYTTIFSFLALWIIIYLVSYNAYSFRLDSPGNPFMMAYKIIMSLLLGILVRSFIRERLRA
ncbi:MAG: hypothetical protein CVV44_11310 [Spirochaetae bacterium HGW-Spirochaetae-1]|jgi:hypothetical protein|nr:MAG: hypothetical protein CVV44_11310 [Spirochaetae bacterium HGW-Spirochaetae-1]